MQEQASAWGEHAYETRDSRRLRVLVVLAGSILAMYWTAALAGVPSSVLSLVFTVVVPLLPPLVWWAALRAPPELRLFTLLAACAATCQGIGTVLWYVAFLRNGSEVPEPPGYWTPFIHVALMLAAGAAWAGVRTAIRLRQATLDYSVVFAAAGCVAVAAVGQQLETGLSAASLDAALRPVFNVLIVTLVASAALGRWQALPLPVVLLGVAQTFGASGDLLFGFLSAQGEYDDDRWTGLLWFTADVIAMVGAATIILGIDRPVRLGREALPATNPRALLITAVGAWAIAASVTVYGAMSDHRAALFAGVAAGAWIGLAVPLRTLGALEESRAAYARLDHAHLRLERASEEADQLVRERDETIDALARRNIELNAVQTMLGSLFELPNERSDGELRARLEETAEEITAWLPPGESRG